MRFKFLVSIAATAFAAVQADATTYVKYTVQAYGTVARQYTSDGHIDVFNEYNTFNFYTNSNFGAGGSFPPTTTGISNYSLTMTGLTVQAGYSAADQTRLSFAATGSTPAVDGLPYFGTLVSGSVSFMPSVPSAAYFDSRSFTLTGVSTFFSSTQIDGVASVAFTKIVTGVPEPTTWAMFIGGFGLIGAAMRRRQRVALTFA